MGSRDSTIFKNWLIFAVIVSVFVLNSTSTSNFIIVTLLFLLLCTNLKSLKKHLNSKMLFLLGSLCSIIVGALLVYNEIDLLRIGSLLIVLFTFPYKFHFSVKQYKLLLIIGLYMFVLQVGHGLNIGFISNYINSYYPIDINGWMYGDLEVLSDLNDVRFAGIFYNPNIMGQSMLLLFCLLLEFIKISSNKILVFSIVFVFFISILLTGGRTAMFTFLIINYFAFKKHYTKKHFIFAIPLLLLMGLFFLPVVGTFLANFRVFDLGSTYGENTSGSVKINILLDWLSQLFMDANFNLFQVIFGIGSIPTQFDFDFGYILQMFGFFGFAVLFSFLIKIYRVTMLQYRFVFFIFLISIGATVIINFRFSILTFVILSMYNIENKLKYE